MKISEKTNRSQRISSAVAGSSSGKYSGKKPQMA